MKCMQESEQINKQKIFFPHVVDLFSGCGGLSYGFHLEEFEIVAGIEKDNHACRTASYNLHWKHGKDREHLCEDINNVEASTIDRDIDKPVMVIGGPPCQAYSRIGKSKIRSLGEHRFGLNDKRAFLYKEFIRLSLDLNAEVIVMENVPESVNFLGNNIPQTVSEILEQNGYNAVWTILNAADYGVPQTRERVFVIGIKSKYGEIEFLPEPTHVNPKWRGKQNIESRFKKFKDLKNFRFPLTAAYDAPSWITVGDALSDLPGLFPNSRSKYTLEKIDTLKPYQTPPINEFQKFMRKLPKGEYAKSVSANCFRKTPRDFRIFEKMQPSDDYREALKIALNLFEEACDYNNINKNTEIDSYNRIKKDYVPPYDATKFHSKWKRLNPEKPSHTLVAHLGTDTYSHIHPFEPRGISVREAARLQSFPDDFIFSVPMGSAFTQIGNAVPPLLASGVAKAVLKNINK